ncbi:putative ribonuclease H-like domain-containing protein [Tanacetum coccineum]
MTHPHSNRKFVPQAVLTRSGKINTAGASVNTAVRPVNIVGSKTTVNHPRQISNSYKKGCSQVTRPFNKHMTGKICYLTEYEDYDGGFVSFRDGKSRISGKDIVSTDKNSSIVEELIDRHHETIWVVLYIFLNTYGSSGKLDGKADEGFFVGYSVVSKAMRVFNKRTRIVEETLNIRFLENAPNVIGNEPDWLFDVDSLTISMNYVPVIAGNQTNGIAGKRDNIVAGQAEKKIEHEQEYILIPFYTTDPLISQGPKDSKKDVGMKPTKVNESGASDKGEEDEQDTRSEFERLLQLEKQTNSTNSFNTVGTPVNAAEASNAFEDHLFERFSFFKNAFTLPHVPNVFSIDDTGIFGNAYNDEVVGAEADLNNLETIMNVSPIPTTRIDKDHPKDQIIGDLNLAIQTRRMTKISDEHAMNPRRNKKDKRGIVVKNKARLVAQGYTQEEGIDYDEVFAPIARIEAIRLFLAYASFMGFIVYQMDVKSAFLYGTIEEEVYVCQPPGFEDPHFPNKVYKVEKALYGLHQALRAWYETFSTYLIENRFRRGTIDKTLFIKKNKGDILLVQVYIDDIIFGSTKKSLCDEFEGLVHKRFQMSSMGELTFFLGLQVQQKEDGIFISQDKYVAEILKKFDFATVKTASTPIETNKALVKDEEAEAVDVHLYRSMIGSLMYLTASRPDIMFVVCACARFQVTPKTSHIHVVKRIFRYLKGQPKLGLWYPRDSPFDLETFSDSDYAGASLDRKSTIGGCQFLGRRLISWQCKNQAIVANSTTEAEYVAAANCCGQLLWIQNQMLYYGFKFMNTKIYIDNESTICIVKNPVFHFKTKHIEIRHRFIRDSYEKKLIQVTKIHIDHNVADLLTKAFDVSSGPIHLVTDETVHKELGDKMERAATIAFSLEVEQDSDLVDKKKVIIIETSIRSDLNLEDAGGTDCLPTDTIFEELARMGAKTTAWNEFSSTMASTIICLATNQNFNLSKYIFDDMLGDMSHHKKIYVNPSHTKKIFANIKREGKDFSGRVTPLFATMMVQANQEEGVDLDIPIDSQQTPITTQPSTSKPQKKQSRKKQRKDIKDRMQLHELMNLCTKLSDRVLTLETTKTTQSLEIASLKSRVKQLEKKASKRTHKFKRLYRVGSTRRVESSNNEVDETQGRSDDTEMFDTDALIGDEVSAAETLTTAGIKIPVSTAAPSTTAVTPPVITKVEITLAQTLAELKSVKSKVVIQEPVHSTVTTVPSTIPKAKGITFRDAGETTTRTPTIVSSSSIKEKGKAKMIELEVPLNKKDQIMLDEDLARRLDAKEQEAARLKRDNVKLQEQTTLAKIEE